MELYVAVTEYECYDCAGDRMYFLNLLGIGTTQTKAKEILNNAYDKLKDEKHPWTKWRVYKVEADSLDLKSFDIKNRRDVVYSI